MWQRSEGNDKAGLFFAIWWGAGRGGRGCGERGGEGEVGGEKIMSARLRLLNYSQTPLFAVTNQIPGICFTDYCCVNVASI